MTKEIKKESLLLYVELVKALAWPTVFVVILVSFWRPLQSTASIFPVLISRSDVITISGISLRVGVGLKNKASSEVQYVLENISKSNIPTVIKMTDTIWWKDDSIYSKRKHQELLELGLMEIVSEEEMRKSSGDEEFPYKYALRKTKLGSQTQKYLLSVVTEIALQLASEEFE